MSWWEKELGNIKPLNNRNPAKGFAVNFSPGIQLSEIADSSEDALATITGTSDVGKLVKKLPIGKTCNSFFIGQVGAVSVSIAFDFDEEESLGQVLQSVALFIRDDYLTKPKEFKTKKLKFSDVAPVTRLVWLPGDEWWEVIMDAEA